MAFVVDSERKAPKQINSLLSNKIEFHIMMAPFLCKRSSLKWFLLCYRLSDSPLSSCLMREISYQQSYLPLGN